MRRSGTVQEELKRKRRAILILGRRGKVILEGWKSRQFLLQKFRENERIFLATNRGRR